jgi:hypothetical protein
LHNEGFSACRYRHRYGFAAKNTVHAATQPPLPSKEQPSKVVRPYRNNQKKDSLKTCCRAAFGIGSFALCLILEAATVNGARLGSTDDRFTRNILHCRRYINALKDIRIDNGNNNYYFSAITLTVLNGIVEWWWREW